MCVNTLNVQNLSDFIHRNKYLSIRNLLLICCTVKVWILQITWVFGQILLILFYYYSAIRAAQKTQKFGEQMHNLNKFWHCFRFVLVNEYSHFSHKYGSNEEILYQIKAIGGLIDRIFQFNFSHGNDTFRLIYQHFMLAFCASII